MIEDMTIRNLAPLTQKSYVRHVAGLARYFHQSPELLGAAEIRDYQVYMLQERKVSPQHLVQIMAALRFLYNTTLKRSEILETILSPKVGKRLPVVLSREEVAKFLAAPMCLKHRAFLTCVYACGLRSSEAIGLRAQDIDSQRMLVNLNQAKGYKDRVVPLSPRLLVLLRQYWKQYRPQVWLFPGRSGDQPLQGASARHACRKVAQRAGLTKRVTLHCLRHSFATHLLDSGTDVRVIQRLLGHSCLSTTARYTYVSVQKLQEAPNPFETLPLPEGTP
jgi:site-specific recombinase XerD